MINFNGKVAVVGGAGSGIGEATVRLLASLGAKVVVGDVVLERAKAVAEAINGGGGVATALWFDLHDEASIRKLIEDSVAHYGRIDILHANAADLSPKLMQGDMQILNAEAEIWDQTFHANCTGTMLCTKYVIPHMIAGGGGSIVLTASNTANRGNLQYSAYAASKAAIVQMTKQIAAQYGKQGVRANAVLPAMTLSETVKGYVAPEIIDQALGETLTPRLCEPADIAYAVAFLASDVASMITAQALLVDGGEGAHWPGISRLRELV